MPENETPTQNAEPESPEKQAGAAPDALRRKLAKAALSAPVILSFGPRRVLGAGCAPGVLSIINSIDGAGGARPALGGSYQAVQDGAIDQCFSCLEDPDNQCTGGRPDQEAYCEDLFENSTAQCPVSNAAPSGDESLTTISSENCIPQTIAAPIAAPAPAPLPPAPRPSRWELWMSRRSGTTLQPSTTFAQPTYTQPSTSTSGGLLDRRNAWLARRRGTTAPTTTVTAPAAAEPVVQTGACGEQISVAAPAPAPAPAPTRLSRRELWESLRRSR